MTYLESIQPHIEQSKDSFEKVRDDVKSSIISLADDIFDSPEGFTFGVELSNETAVYSGDGTQQKLQRFLPQAGSGTINVSRTIATESESINPDKEWKSYMLYFDLGVDRYEFSLTEMRKNFIIAQHTDFNGGEKHITDISNDSEGLLEASVALELLREAITKQD